MTKYNFPGCIKEQRAGNLATAMSLNLVQVNCNQHLSTPCAAVCRCVQLSAGINAHFTELPERGEQKCSRERWSEKEMGIIQPTDV